MSASVSQAQLNLLTMVFSAEDRLHVSIPSSKFGNKSSVLLNSRHCPAPTASVHLTKRIKQVISFSNKWLLHGRKKCQEFRKVCNCLVYSSYHWSQWNGYCFMNLYIVVVDIKFTVFILLVIVCVHPRVFEIFQPHWNENEISFSGSKVCDYILESRTEWNVERNRVVHQS